MSTQAAQHNASILQAYNFDVHAEILAQSPSKVSFGSEFRKSSDLMKLLSSNLFWPCLRELLDNGATFPLSSIDDITRKEGLDFHFNRGNHQSTVKYQNALDKAIAEDIIRGFALPLPLTIINSIPKALRETRYH